jgi:hypothetical protein
MTTFTPAERNWAGNHVYAGRVVRPRSVEELQHVVAASGRVGSWARGTRSTRSPTPTC